VCGAIKCYANKALAAKQRKRRKKEMLKKETIKTFIFLVLLKDAIELIAIRFGTISSRRGQTTLSLSSEVNSGQDAQLPGPAAPAAGH